MNERMNKWRTRASGHSQSFKENMGLQTGQWKPQPLEMGKNIKTEDLEGTPTRLHIAFPKSHAMFTYSQYKCHNHKLATTEV